MCIQTAIASFGALWSEEEEQQKWIERACGDIAELFAVRTTRSLAALLNLAPHAFTTHQHSPTIARVQLWNPTMH